MPKNHNTQHLALLKKKKSNPEKIGREIYKKEKEKKRRAKRGEERRAERVEIPRSD